MAIHFTVGYPVTPNMKLLEQTSRLHGFDYRPLPRTVPAARLGYIDKFRYLHAALASGEVVDEELVLFTDAYDVGIFDSVEAIVRSFLALDADIVFNGEAFFWPTFDPAHVAQYKPLFEGPDKCRYLNSGCYIGYVWAIREMLAYALAEVDNDKIASDDQLLAQRYWLHARTTAGAPRVTVDSKCTIFATVGKSVWDYVLAGNALVHTATKRPMGVLHVNGDKAAMEVIRFYCRLYTYRPLPVYDIRVHYTADGYLTYDPDRRVLYSRPDWTWNGLVFVLRAGRRCAIIMSSGDFLSYLPNGTLDTASQFNQWECYDYPSFTAHNGDILTQVTPGGNRALTTPLVPLTIDAITQGRLSKFADRIPLFFPHI